MKRNEQERKSLGFSTPKNFYPPPPSTDQRKLSANAMLYHTAAADLELVITLTNSFGERDKAKDADERTAPMSRRKRAPNERTNAKGASQCTSQNMVYGECRAQEESLAMLPI